jgi:hypothetical protein
VPTADIAARIRSSIGELRLAIVYRERQQSEPVGFWDRKPTLSGCARGEQRRRFDERRSIVLPQHGKASARGATAPTANRAGTRVAD